MINKPRKVAILTSGGDGPGMNAAVRAVVRSGLAQGLEVEGVMRGYEGLLHEEFVPLTHRSVSDIINRGGTILKTARSKEFATDEGKEKVVQILRKRNTDVLIAIGGDGTYTGASRLFEKFGFPTIGLPGTIDNDLNGTDQTIGCNTAVDTALSALDKIRDTAHSMERIFIVEVMGNRSGYIAVEVALGAGAEDVIVPEYKFDYQSMCQNIIEGHNKGKVSWMVIVAEGAGKAHEIATTVATMTGLETRCVVLGHIQRGGDPNGADRILATRLGVAAIELVLQGSYGKAVGIIQDRISIVNLSEAKRREFPQLKDYLGLVKLLS